MADKDGDYSHAQFLSLAQKLLEQGRRPDRVFIGMLRAAYDASKAHSLRSHYCFVSCTADTSAEWKTKLEEILDDMIGSELRGQNKH